MASTQDQREVPDPGRWVKVVAIAVVVLVVLVAVAITALILHGVSPHRTVDCAVGFHWNGSRCVTN